MTKELLVRRTKTVTDYDNLKLGHEVATRHCVTL